MDHQEVGRFWNENAEVWTMLAREGYDIYRDHLNTPAFFSILPEVKNLKGIDIGCGEGYNTRLLTKKGAFMTGIDISEVFIQKANEAESVSRLNILYKVASAVELPFANEQFDFATGFMSFMDIPEIDKVIKEAYRVLKFNGFLQFSISHPCFFTRYRINKKDPNGKTYAVEIGDYFNKVNGEIDEWLFTAAPKQIKQTLPKFKVPRFYKTLSEWLNILIETGFILEKINEPFANDETIIRIPKLQDTQVVPYFFHIRCRKPKN